MTDDFDFEQMAREGRVRDFQGPYFFASSFRIASDSNIINVSLQRPTPLEIALPSGQIADAGRFDTIAVLALSPQSAKDLHLLLKDQIEKYEEAFGTIETAYMRRMESAPK